MHSFMSLSHLTKRSLRCFKIFVIVTKQESSPTTPSNMTLKNFRPIYKGGDGGRYWQEWRLNSHLAFIPVVSRMGSFHLQTKRMILAYRRSLTSPKIRNRKWWWSIFLWAVGVAATNGYILYDRLYEEERAKRRDGLPRKWNHLEFLCELIHDFMGWHSVNINLDLDDDDVPVSSNT